MNLERLKQIGIYKLQNIICYLPPKMAHFIIYFREHGSFMNWKTPTTYDEKIHLLLANVYDGSLGMYVDKYQVRSYVEQCGFYEMLHAATVLSKPFLLARIAFYIINNKLYFGEVTLSPSAGNHHYLNQKGQTELGKMIDLRNLKSGRRH